MTSRTVLLCLPLLLTVLSCLVEAAWEDWNTGYGGVKWLLNCDFPGYDIGNRPSSGQDCGRICMENPNCNHFSHFNGICYMKTVPIAVPRTPANGVMCGFLPCHHLYDPLSGHYCYNKG
ncbi:hypothetical protein GHT06_016513 [Daphnia sinensis]|uniref:Apple domain-containing protein n=1 Tax=Daphnia sinensis TaxID=1820382 RepID=A0AAD5KNQ1_9CRUS|nr:hypothetical protein GHT06_016513 [Daphnia sinensis]